MEDKFDMVKTDNKLVLHSLYKHMKWVRVKKKNGKWQDIPLKSTYKYPDKFNFVMPPF
jgi:hypothetical protein